jgi:hypothetical protein
VIWGQAWGGIGAMVIVDLKDYDVGEYSHDVIGPVLTVGGWDGFTFSEGFMVFCFDGPGAGRKLLKSFWPASYSCSKSGMSPVDWDICAPGAVLDGWDDEARCFVNIVSFQEHHRGMVREYLVTGLNW